MHDFQIGAAASALSLFASWAAPEEQALSRQPRKDLFTHLLFMQILVQALFFLEFTRTDFKKEKLEIFNTRPFIVNKLRRKINENIFFFF